MAEVADSSIGPYEWESVWNHPTGANGIPTECIRQKQGSAGRNAGIPHTKEFYLDIYRKSLFEPDALLPTHFIIVSVHLVCGGNLLAVTRRK